MATKQNSAKSSRSAPKSTARAKTVKSATNRVKTRAPINFSRSVRGR